MARGRKKETRTLDEQLQAVIGEIATYEEKLKELAPQEKRNTNRKSRKTKKRLYIKQ